MSSVAPLPHIVIFPFFSKGHTIPLLHLAHLLRRRCLATVTFFTTPLNAPFIRSSLAGTVTDIIELPFPDNVPGLPTGVESTDNLPSMSLFLPFVRSIRLLQPPFEQALSRLPTVTFLISDMFIGWTVESASKFAIPRVVFSGMGNFAAAITAIVSRELPHASVCAPDEPFLVPGFPRIQLTKADLSPPFDEPGQDSPLKDFVTESRKYTRESHGALVNSFYELEAAYIDCWNNRELGPKAWCVGPLCLARPKAAETTESGGLLEWLDSKSAECRPVLYVAFGTQAEVSAAQLKEIEMGLEQSGLDFLWVVKANGSNKLGEGFEMKVRERGRVVRNWVDQLEILQHESVKGFVSHCGWNSVMESVCAGVPILAWPMMAEQPLNAKLVVEELRIGLQIHARDGTRNGLVMHEDISEMAKELILGEKGRMAREKVKDFAELASKAVTDGGSSATTLEMMIEELLQTRRDSWNGTEGERTSRRNDRSVA